MRYDKRIWKTAAIAVTITVFAGAFAMRLGDWVKGLNSEFIVYGSSPTGTGSGGSSGSSGATLTQVIPQVAVGSFDGGGTSYQTFIIVTNPSTASSNVAVSANFYNTTGSATGPVQSSLIGFTTTTVAPGASTSTTSTFTGSTPTALSLAPGATLTFQSQALASGVAGTTGWGEITSTSTGTSANVAITAGYSVSLVQTGAILSIVGVAASPANMQTFTMARSRNQQVSLDTGFAIVNTGTTQATLKATLTNLSGTVISTQYIALNPGAQISQFGTALFYPTAGSEPTLSGTNVFSMTFDASATNSAQFAATALTFEGTIQASYPVIQLK